MTHRRLVLSFALALGTALGAAACSPSGSRATAPTPAAPAQPLSADRSASAVSGAAGSNAAAVSSAAVTRLRPYNVDPQRVFVAGVSAGGFFGVQLDVAHSRTFNGAAIYAGGVYHCAQDSVVIALTACGGEGLYASTLAASEAYLDAQGSQGTIDPPAHLAGKPVYLWSGTQDDVVKQAEVNDLQTEYEHYGARVRYDNGFPAAHGWESPDGELPCGTQGTPYMIACDRGTGRVRLRADLADHVPGPARAAQRGRAARQPGALRPDRVRRRRRELDGRQRLRVRAQVVRAGRARAAWCVALHGCLQTQTRSSARSSSPGAGMTSGPTRTT